MRFGTSLQTKYKRECGDRLLHKVGSSCSFSLLKDRIAARIQPRRVLNPPPLGLVLGLRLFFLRK